MQQPGINCERDEYPPIGFWQNHNIHHQWVRMVPGAENEAAGAALFNLRFCRFDGQGNPPVSTRNAAFDRVVHGPDRDTSIYTAEVTTTLSTVSIRFNAFPNEPDFGLTANPCWPSTLVDDPGFALLISDGWYAEGANAQRAQTAHDFYGRPPPFALTQNNPPRQGYQKRSLDPLNMELLLNERNTTNEQTECLIKLGFDECHSTNHRDESNDMQASSVPVARPRASSVPKACEAQPTAANVDLATTTAPMVCGGAQSAFNSIAKPTVGTV